MREVLLGMFGGGALVSFIGILLQVWQKQKGTNIDWYDRAMEQVKLQDEMIERLRKAKRLLEDDNSHLRKENDDLKEVIEDIDRLLQEIEIGNTVSKARLMNFVAKEKERFEWWK